MRTRKSIDNAYKTATEGFRKEMVGLILALCKQTGINPSIDIQFTNVLFIHTTEPFKKNGVGLVKGITTHTLVTDSLHWHPEHGFFMLKWQGHACQSSDFLTLDTLVVVYEEMKRVLAKL